MTRGTEHIPDDKTRKMVEAMSSYGIPQADISLVVGICENTLRKHYEYELATAAAKANSQVAQRLYKKCIEDGDTTSMIFWLKTRARWAETMKQEITGKDGGPVEHTLQSTDQEIINRYILSKGLGDKNGTPKS